MVPHEAPVPLRLALVQTGLPEVHEMEPLKHGFEAVHAAPAAQFTHMPLASHTWLEPHVVPGALLPLSMQRSAPVPQSVTPFLHAPGLVPQVAPAPHVMHAPMPLHTRPAPQLVPAVTFPLSTQTELPELQSVRPATHGAPGLVVHIWLATHMPQLPFESHTWAEPQAVPAILLLPSTQVVAPVAHELSPLRQAGFGLVVQAMAAVQLTQLPLTLQTWLVPHVVPGGRLPESMHVWTPVVHEVMPVLQEGLGLVVQAVPATHATHEPLALHTWSGPHAVPAVTLVESTQRVLPVLQSMTPVLHGAPMFEVHAMPAVHMPQKPLASHTWPMPQVVPADLGMPSAQV